MPTATPVCKDVAGLVLEALPDVSKFAGNLNMQCHSAAFSILAKYGIIDTTIYDSVSRGLWNALSKPIAPRRSSSHCDRTARALAEIEDRAPVLEIFTPEQTTPSKPRQEEQLTLL